MESSGKTQDRRPVLYDPSTDNMLELCRPRMPGEYDPPLAKKALEHPTLVKNWDDHVYRGRDVNDAVIYERARLEKMYGNQRRDGFVTGLLAALGALVVVAVIWFYVVHG